MVDTTILAKPVAQPRAFPDWLLGVSFAATWTWAVSVLVGMALLREQGTRVWLFEGITHG